jgi:CIC family chloride channel protein
MVQGAELSRWLAQKLTDEERLDVTDADVRRWAVTAVPARATMRQALDSMHNKTAEAVWVYALGAGGKRVLQGIVTREGIERFSLSKL